MKFNLYSVWTDPVFYLSAAVFALALFFLVFAISKYLEITNNSDFEEGPEEAAGVQGELPLAAVVAPAQQLDSEAAGQLGSEAARQLGSQTAGQLDSETAGQPEPKPVPASEPSSFIPHPSSFPQGRPAAQPSGAPEPVHDISKAEEFVKGLYRNMASLDGRMKNIEAIVAKANVNREFTATFLEGMLADFDTLNKEKIKTRLEYLLSDLKK
ncbi:MAG: hypothetical protein KKH28_08015 [Elusimicrobia bacterium]|nr:hypothetical protein [Elusimicrobiota bacterium]